MPSSLTLPAPLGDTAPERRVRRRGVLPGFGLTMGLTLTWLSLIVLIPLSALLFKTATMGLDRFWEVVTAERALAAYQAVEIPIDPPARASEHGGVDRREVIR